MRASNLFIFSLACIATLPMSCSLITSYAGLGSGGAGGDATTTTTSSGDTNGGGGQAGHGGATSNAGGTNDPTQSGGGGASVVCTPGGTYCGNDGVNRDPNTLYKCDELGMLQFDQRCMRNCVIAPPTPNPQADLCSCTKGGFYCGGDDVVGDPNSLYQCTQTGSTDGTLVMRCDKSCTVVPGHDDMCN